MTILTITNREEWSMNTGRIVFAQLMDFLPTYEFHKCVDRYRGKYKVQSFSCWNQYLYMAFAQLTYRESLRDIESCLRAMRQKLYHLGIRGKVSRSTLAYTNSESRLAYLRRFRSSAYSSSQKVICRRRLRRRVRSKV